jgi:hypothetical protein
MPSTLVAAVSCWSRRRPRCSFEDDGWWLLLLRQQDICNIPLAHRKNSKKNKKLLETDEFTYPKLLLIDSVLCRIEIDSFFLLLYSEYNIRTTGVLRTVLQEEHLQDLSMATTGYRVD